MRGQLIEAGWALRQLRFEAARRNRHNELSVFTCKARLAKKKAGARLLAQAAVKNIPYACKVKVKGEE
jgi:hypothetical protein